MTLSSGGTDGTTTTPDRARGALLGILLLVAASAVPAAAALASPEFHQDTRQVVTAALYVSALPTLVLAVAASVRRGTGLLLAATGVAVVHLVGAVVLLVALGHGDGEAVLRVTVQLVGAVVGLGVAWWRTRDRRVGLLVAPAIIVAGHLIAVVAPLDAFNTTWWMLFAPYNVLGALPVIGLLVVALLLGLVGRDGDGRADAREESSAGESAGADGASAGPSADGPPGPGLLAAEPPVGQSARSARLAGAAVLAIAAAAALDVPALFAHGPGIRPGGAGVAFLVLQLVVAAVPAALVLAAGAAASGRRWLLVLASLAGAGLVVGLGAASTVGGARPAAGLVVQILCLAVALVLAWIARGQRTSLRWAAVVLVVVAAVPWGSLLDADARLYQGDPRFWRLFVEPHLPALAAVVAAALVALGSRWTRVAGAVVLAVLVVDDLGTLLDQAAMLRRLTALNGLRVAAHLTACLLAVAAAAAVRVPAARPRPAEAGVRAPDA